MSGTGNEATALVTGASSGVGLALVRLLLSRGMRVRACYRSNPAPLQELASRFDKQLLLHRLDLADPDSIDALASEAGDVAHLINNAGLGTATVRRLSSDRREQDRLLMTVNALGPVWLTTALLPALRRRRHASVIHVASVGGGIFHFPGFAHADGMSKAALTFHGRQLASELVDTPVRVFTICPGAIDTPMFRASTLDGLDPGAREALIRSLPGGRLIAPDEIAELCWQLMQPQCAVLHGAVIDASLGLGVAPWRIVRG